MSTLYDWMTRAAAERPDAPAIGAGDRATGFAELHGRALFLVEAFHSLGLGRGDVIAAQLPNTLDFVATYLASGYIGAALQTLHMPYRAAEIVPLLRHSKAAAVVCPARIKDFSPAQLLLASRPSLPSLRHVIVTGEEVPPGAHLFPEGHREEPGAGFTPPIETDRHLLLYTSGTTDAPKGVPVSYRKFLPNAARSSGELGIDATSVLLSAAPFTHLYGLFSLNMALSTGAATALMPAYTPAALAEALDRMRPTGLFVAPAHVSACMDGGLLTPERLSCLRFILVSGSPCPPELAETLQANMRNGEVLQLWGMSELQAGAFTRPGDDRHARFSTAGRASPGTELRVVVDGTPAALGEEGELEVRGPSVFDGYLDSPKATAGAFTEDGWFRTGDLAVMDEQGNIRITGRLKDVINRGGVKFNPADIEALIARHAAVAACAIVPLPDPVLGERACCFVVPEENAAPPALADLCTWLASHGIAKLKWPERLELIAEMPMTPTRKIKKGELVQRYARQPAPDL